LNIETRDEEGETFVRFMGTPNHNIKWGGEKSKEGLKRE